MTTTRLALVLLSAALALAGPAAAATPPAGPAAPVASPAQKTAELLSAARSARARKGLGQPSYRKLIGRRWARKVRRADAAFAASLTPPAGAAQWAPGLEGNDPLAAKDSMRGPGGKQTRTLKFAAAFDSDCPTPGSLGGFWVNGQARGDYVVTTVERVGRYDVTTTVTFEMKVEFSESVGSGVTIDGPGANHGTVSVTRRQTARDRRTGRTRPTGPTQRLNEALGPLWDLDGEFDDFIDRQDRDESPAPRRPLRSAIWDEVAQRFINVVYMNIVKGYETIQQRIRTPNVCVTLSFETPERLAPGQAVDLTGILHSVQGTATNEQIVADARVVDIEYVNAQGQTIELTSGDPYASFRADKPWYTFTAPLGLWPEERPAGVKFLVETRAGMAETTIGFKPIEANLYFKVLDVRGSVDATDVKTVSGECTFTGSPHHIDIGPGAAGGAPHGQLVDGFGHIESPITYTTQAYSTQYACPGYTKTCDHAPASLPNQSLGVNLRQTPGGKLAVAWSFVAVQLGHSGCSLQVPDLFVDRTLLESELPLAAFQGTEPFKIETAKTQTYSVTQGISTMSGKLSWNFEMTLQRVGPDGTPLP